MPVERCDPFQVDRNTVPFKALWSVFCLGMRTYYLRCACVLQVQETKTPLAAAVSAVMAYADAWGPSGFPVPLDEQDGDSSQAAISVDQAMRPKPLLLHRAVWAQAEVLATRCQLLLRAGETLSTELRRKADLVRHRSTQSDHRSDSFNYGNAHLYETISVRTKSGGCLPPCFAQMLSSVPEISRFGETLGTPFVVSGRLQACSSQVAVDARPW